MIKLPSSTIFNRVIPKKKFYENLSVSASLKRVFVEQINQIVWRNKISPATVNLAAGEAVKEIEIFSIKLNQHALDTKVLAQIDKTIPYHILFLLEHGNETQAWIAYKEASNPVAYYHTDWQPADREPLTLSGLNMDTAYESLIRQVAGARLAPDTTPDIYDIKEAVERDIQRRKLEKEITALEKKAITEQQPRRKWKLVEKVKQLREKLNNE